VVVKVVRVRSITRRCDTTMYARLDCQSMFDEDDDSQVRPATCGDRVAS
jgi:hypothetical protein